MGEFSQGTLYLIYTTLTIKKWPSLYWSLVELSIVVITFLPVSGGRALFTPGPLGPECPDRAIAVGLDSSVYLRPPGGGVV